VLTLMGTAQDILRGDRYSGFWRSIDTCVTEVSN